MERGLGYLAFEDAEGKLDLVDADRLGNLLAAARIPLMVLDACQSAHADVRDPFSSVAPRLIQAGVGSVVAMQYSVLVETTRRFFGAFYEALARGRTVGQAVDEGRRVLLANTKRFTLYHLEEGEVAFHLRDWFLPALYQQTEDPAPFAGTIIRSSAQTAASTLLGEFREPRYRFTGRAKELWDLERLLRERRIVVMHGFGGQGKTALAGEAARWFRRIGLVRRALFISFEGGGDAGWAVSQMGRLLLGDSFSTVLEADRLPALQQALVSDAPTLVIWDNLESVLPGWHDALPPEALRELLELGVALTSDGVTRLLVTTRDFGLPHEAYAPSQSAALIPLDGLLRSEALAFAGEVLDALGHQRPERPDLERLLGYLGGHPLSIQLVLPHLKDFGNNVATVIDRFDELYPGFTEGWARDRHESLEVSLSFSLNRLSPAAQEHLPALGVFQGGAMEVQILRVTRLRPSRWREIRAELERAGLFIPEEEMPIAIETEEGEFSGRYVRFHPTLTPHLRAALAPDARRSMEERYCQVYYDLSRHLYNAAARDPHEVRAIAGRELPNLRRALDLTLAAGKLERGVDFADNVGRFLSWFGRLREWETLTVRIEAVAKTGSLAAEAPLAKTEYLAESQRGEMLLDTSRAKEAEQVFRRLLARMDAGMAYGGTEAGRDRARTLIRLGSVLKAQGRAGDAETALRQALQVLAGPDQEGTSIRDLTSNIHTELGDVLVMQGRYAEARRHYELALDIHRARGDELSVAGTLGNIGTLALEEGDFAEARRRHREAEKQFHALGDSDEEATARHQQGKVAFQEAQGATGERRAALLAEAEGAFRESLRLREAIGNRAGGAMTVNGLGAIAVLADRYADAERWFRRGIELCGAAGNPGELAKVYTNLAALILLVYDMPSGECPREFEGRDLLAEAEASARHSLEIREAIGDSSHEVWANYSILTAAAQRRGDKDSVRHWRRKGRLAFAAFPGNRARLAREGGGLLRAIRDALAGKRETLAFLEQEYLKMAAGTAEWHDAPSAIRRLLAGERNVDDLADELDLGTEQYLILRMALEEDADAESMTSPTEHPAIQGLAPLVLALLHVCRGNEDLRMGVETALDNLAAKDDWKNLAAALRRVLNGDRDPAALVGGAGGAPALDQVDQAVLDLALGALAGDPEVQARLERLAGAAQGQTEGPDDPQSST
ncbi:MAG: tetratricopeptide repeat protein [Armatimonadetes bacterium]|nr:tetratricopeptide repeat protein [Armatimonadota bacterium]